MTGEMIYALSQHTILKGSVDLSTSELDGDALALGLEAAERDGVNRAIFKTRVMDVLFGASNVSTYSFFLGVVLCDEIRDILSSRAKTVVIGGREQIKRATAELVRRKSEKRVIELSEREVFSSVALGAVKIFEYQKQP
jgi:2-keto-3-deoxy-galactonokinase